MTTYNDLVNKVLRVLKDSDGSIYDDELIYDGLFAAHDAILPWVPNFGAVTITAGSDGSRFAVPSNFYSADAVQIVSTGLYIPRSTMSPGTVRNMAYATNNDWTDYPRGYISLSNALEDDSIKLYYRSTWSKPSSASATTFQIEVPTIAHNGMVYYAASHCLSPDVRNNATLGQFKMRPELGAPDDLPFFIVADYFMKRFYAEMKMMPPFVRVGGM